MSIWPITTIGEISEVVTKGTTPTSVGHKFIDSGINFIKVESIDNNGNFKPEKFAHIDESCHESLKRSQLKDGDILFSIAGALGRTALVTQSILPANTNQALSIVRIKSSEKIFTPFVLKALSSKLLIEQIEKKRGGVAQQNLSLTQVKEFEIPLPSLSEQKRIVAILDEAFAGIDQAIANTEKNLASARELFDSYLNNIFTQKGEGWEEVPLERLADLDKEKHNQEDDLPYVGMEDISSQTGKFLGSSDPLQVKSTTFKFSSEHVLYGRLRPYLNKVLLPNFEGHCSTEIFPIRASENLNREFLFYWLIKKSTVDKINATCTGARMPRANMKEVMKFRICVPVITEQKNIVKVLNELRTQLINLENIYNKKITSLNELKQSILQKAFSGELTADVIDEVKAEAAA